MSRLYLRTKFIRGIIFVQIGITYLIQSGDYFLPITSCILYSVSSFTLSVLGYQLHHLKPLLNFDEFERDFLVHV